MFKKITGALDFIIYWSIVIMPFSVAIAPGLANTFIGFFAGFFIIKKIIKRERPFIAMPVILPFILMMVIAALSFRNSVSFSTSFSGLEKLFKSLLIFVVCAEEIKDRKHVSRIVISIILGISLVSVDAVWQIIFGRDFIRGNTLQQAIGLVRPTASFPNPNVFGVYMSALTPIAIGLTLFYFKGKKRILMLFISALATTGLSLTLSRGAGLALYLSTLFLCIAKKKKILTLVLIAVLVIFPFVMPKNIKQWAKGVNYNPLVLMCNQDRISIYRNTINMIKHHPFTGVGVNTFSKNYGKYKTESAEKYAPTPDTIYAHNIYLQMAGEIGLSGLLVFLWFLTRIFKRALRAYRTLKDDYLKTIALSVVACFIAFLVNGLTETSLYYSRVAMVFWYLIGISLALSRISVKEQ